MLQDDNPPHKQRQAVYRLYSDLDEREKNVVRFDLFVDTVDGSRRNAFFLVPTTSEFVVAQSEVDY